MESISRYHKHETLKLKDNENYVLEDYSISHYAFMNLCLNHRALDTCMRRMAIHEDYPIG